MVELCELKCSLLSPDELEVQPPSSQALPNQLTAERSKAENMLPYLAVSVPDSSDRAAMELARL